MAAGTVHIVGAGLAGLSAAVRLVQAGRTVVVHELARFAGGRCRSLYEPVLDLTIDNGNHLLLSANHAALSFLKILGTGHLLHGPEEAEFPFADLTTGKRWTVRPNSGRIGWWIFSEQRRVPGTRPLEYLALAKLLAARADQTIADVIDTNSALYHKLLHPVLISALNTDPKEASAKLAGAIVRETLAQGGSATRPLVAPEGLGPVFVEPAVEWLQKNGAGVRFDHAVRKIEFNGTNVTGLEFAEDKITLGPADSIILAVPGWVARTLVPDLKTPSEYRAIVNAHYKIVPPKGTPALQGVLGGTTEWLFAFADRLSVTVSAADRLINAEREPLAREIWGEVVKLTGLPPEMPAWQIIKERRATFAATPAQNAKRPGTQTQWRNLLLAGDWTQTGLPSTIEGSIRSGVTAATLARALAF